MMSIVSSIGAEFLRYKALAEAAIAQLTDDQLTSRPPAGNSVAVICCHIGGNLRSRFTDFLTTDGEKPWRNREEEFSDATITRVELASQWEQGWTVLSETLSGLNDIHLVETVTIRGEPLRVDEALHRSLAHVSYHVGQVVYAARALRGDAWTFLSIPPGQSALYNSRPFSTRSEMRAPGLTEPQDPKRI